LKKLQNVYANSENAILVLVDIENEFCKPGGKMYGETSAKVAPGMISVNQKLIAQARSARVPVLYVQSVRTGSEPEFTVFGRKPIVKEGSWGAQIVDELKPQEKDQVVQKFCHDPFVKPDLDKILKKLTPDPTRFYAIVTGGNMNVCVYQTALGFHNRHYWTVIPLDAVFYGSEQFYRTALDMFSDAGAYPNVIFSRSDLIEFTTDPELTKKRPVPGI
jgi:nicotinamidase-related amidase